MMTVTMAFHRIALLQVKSVTFSPLLNPQSSLHLSHHCAFEHLFGVPYSASIPGSIPIGLIANKLVLHVVTEYHLLEVIISLQIVCHLWPLAKVSYNLVERNMPDLAITTCS